MSEEIQLSRADPAGVKNAARPVKVVVWDLDETIWRGTLSERDHLCLREGIPCILKELDSRGILSSIASRNDHEDAIRQLRRFEIAEYFVAPAITWGRKTQGLESISARLGLGLDTFLFIDDQEVELAEARFEFPQVRTLAASAIDGLLDLPEVTPATVTREAALRREFYARELLRKEAENAFQGSSDEFLATLEMVLTIRSATQDDLERAAELTDRTSQLNATGHAYSVEQLRGLIRTADHTVIVAELSDRYGSYGVIGLSVVEQHGDTKTIKQFLMSCRVLSRGVTGLMLRELVLSARQTGDALKAEFIDTGRNRLVKVAFALAGFHATQTNSERTILEHDGSDPGSVPRYVRIENRATR